MSLNVLLVPLGTDGDVYPYVGLGRVLSERGHRVTLIANGYFRPLAEHHGLAFAAVGTADEYLEAISNRHLLTHPVRGAFPLRDWFCKDIPGQYEAIAERAGAVNTVILASGFASSARMAHEKLGIPWVILALQPMMLPVLANLPNVPGWLPEPGKRLAWRISAICGQWIMGRYVNELRAQLDLPRISKLPASWWLSPACVIGLFPQWYAGKQRTWDIKTRLTDFVMFDGDVGRNFPGDLDTFLDEGEAPIVFTPGSAITHARAFFQTAADACRILRRRGILVTRFPDQLPDELPATVRHVDYAPFSALLPRAAAIVHHGGIGTTAHALAAAIPQLVVPRIYDQPDNAGHIRRLGVGDRLGHLRFRGRSAARKLRDLLGSNEVAHRCRVVARKFQEARPLSHTCELIEQVAQEPGRQPGSALHG